MISLLFTGISYAEEDEGDFIIGKVRELVKSENVIQVRERNYKVELILVDFGLDEEPVMGGMMDLEEGSLVKVYVKGKGDNFWMAEKVIVFTGEKREEMLKELD